jgi:hypothetical protein
MKFVDEEIAELGEGSEARWKNARERRHGAKCLVENCGKRAIERYWISHFDGRELIDGRSKEMARSTYSLLRSGASSSRKICII